MGLLESSNSMAAVYHSINLPVLYPYQIRLIVHVAAAVLYICEHMKLGGVSWPMTR
jgi:hypothetical protein